MPRKPRDAPQSPAPADPPALRRGGADAQEIAFVRLSQGYNVTSVADELGVERKTVRRWRDSPAGRARLDELRRERAEQLTAAPDRARRILLDGAELAATRIVERVRSAVPFEAVNAAEALLSRVGLPRESKVALKPEKPLDLSRLSDEEIATLEALHAKAAGGVG